MRREARRRPGGPAAAGGGRDGRRGAARVPAREARCKAPAAVRLAPLGGACRLAGPCPVSWVPEGCRRPWAPLVVDPGGAWTPARGLPVLRALGRPFVVGPR